MLIKYYEQVDSLFDLHTGFRIRTICGNKILASHLKLIADAPESYIPKKPNPDKATVNELARGDTAYGRIGDAMDGR